MSRSNPLRILLPVAALFTFAGCQAAADLLLEPAPTDPYDGFEGTYPELGVSTESDLGPKEKRLLDVHTELLREKLRIEEANRELRAKNQDLQHQLDAMTKNYETERGERAVHESNLQRVRQDLQEREAMILALRIEKAKAEQQALLLEIDLAEASLRTANPRGAEATAMPPAGR